MHDPSRALPRRGLFPLRRFAISKSQIACALALIDGGARLDQLDDERRTPLHLALQFGGGLNDCGPTLDLASRLIARGVDVNTFDREKRTALHWAAGKNSLLCVDALIAAKADPNALDWAEHTPMHWCCPVDAVESARALLAAGAKVDLADRDRRTPLQWAADHAAEKCLAFLLSTGGVDLEAVDRGGYLALHSAARRASIPCIKALLEAGANRQLLSVDQETPADVAGDEAARAALADGGGAGLKRRRTGSTTSLAGEGLEALAEAFYEAVGGKADLEPLCEASVPAAQLARELGKKPLQLGEAHVCSKSRTVFTELTAGGKAQLHSLTFSAEGRVQAARLYAPS